MLQQGGMIMGNQVNTKSLPSSNIVGINPTIYVMLIYKTCEPKTIGNGKVKFPNYSACWGNYFFSDHNTAKRWWIP